MTVTEAPPDEAVVHVLWINAGLSCDGDSVALTAATQPSIEEIALGALPGLPKIAVHWPLIDFECGPAGGQDDFLEWFFKADRGELDPFVLVVEGSIPNEAIKKEGYWCGFGNNPDTDQPMTTSEWLDRLAPKALVVLCAGTCACYGGIHAMAGNPTGASWRYPRLRRAQRQTGVDISHDPARRRVRLRFLAQFAGAFLEDSGRRECVVGNVDRYAARHSVRTDREPEV